MSEATFEKHDYTKPKWKFRSLEDFDPRPSDLRGLTTSRLPDFLDKVRGEKLGVSLLLDPHFCRTSTVASTHQQTSHNILSIGELRNMITAFKKSLLITDEKAHEIERNM